MDDDVCVHPHDGDYTAEVHLLFIFVIVLLDLHRNRTNVVITESHVALVYPHTRVACGHCTLSSEIRFFFLFFCKFSSSLCFLFISIYSLTLLCVYVGLTDQSGIVWSTFGVLLSLTPPSPPPPL